jgi:hypothetical protein
MEIPFSALVAVAVRYHTFYEDLLDKWGNSLRLAPQQRKRPAPAADAAAPAGDLLEMAVPSRPQQSSSRSGSLASNARERGSGKSGHHRLSSTDKQQQHRRGSGKNISNHQQRHRKRSGSQSSTASSTTFSSSRK